MKSILARIIILALTTAGLSTGLAQSEASGNYKLDAVHSSLVFQVKHLDISPFYGRFNDVSGTFVFNPDNLSTSAFDVTVRTASVDTANTKRDEHLRSPDFFNARQFPTLRFRSTKVEPASEGKLRVTGDLTLHGVTKAVTVNMELTGHGNRGQRGYRAGFSGEFTINRADFGMNYMLDSNALGNEVKILLGLQGVRG